MEREMGKGTRRISVLLTKYTDSRSTFIYYMTGREYTHASISLGDGAYYSFNFHGFCTEYQGKYREKGVVQSVSYDLDVSEAAYARMEQEINKFRNEKKKFHYTWIGLLFCLFHIPLRLKHYFFCSKFVAQVLKSSQEIRLKKPSSLYLPNHFKSELAGCPNLVRVRYGAAI